MWQELNPGPHKMTKDDRHDYARMILWQLLLERVLRHLGWLSKAKNTNPLTENFIWRGKKTEGPIFSVSTVADQNSKLAEEA